MIGPHLQKEPKTPKRILRKIYDTAKGKSCWIRFEDICVGGTETTVFAHLNAPGLGSGKALKSEYGCPACFGCHYELDQGTVLEKYIKRGRHFEQTLKYLHWLRIHNYWEFKDG